MIDDLERLAALHDKGKISDAEYDSAKSRLLSNAITAERSRAAPRAKLLRRSLTDRWLGGVCGGIGKVTDSESWIWRFIFTAGLLLGGVTALLYVLLWIFVPLEEPEGPL